MAGIPCHADFGTRDEGVPVRFPAAVEGMRPGWQPEFTATGLPRGLLIDAVTGTISGIPLPGTGGSHYTMQIGLRCYPPGAQVRRYRDAYVKSGDRGDLEKMLAYVTPDARDDPVRAGRRSGVPLLLALLAGVLMWGLPDTLAGWRGPVRLAGLALITGTLAWSRKVRPR